MLGNLTLLHGIPNARVNTARVNTARNCHIR